VLVQAGRNFTGDFVSSDFLGSVVVTDNFWSKKKSVFPQKHPPLQKKRVERRKRKAEQIVKMLKVQKQ
jgi:hypothetical protein